MSKINALLEEAIKDTTKKWTAAKLASGRQNRVGDRALAQLRHSPRRITIKDAAFRVMREAYMKASANGTLPANARQIMYAARPLVLEITGGEWVQNSATFTQRYLPEYVDQFNVNWDVVFDARGHLAEPHTRRDLGIGTLEVRDYLRRWQRTIESEIDLGALLAEVRRVQTVGPGNRYRNVLFCEKEGFNPLFARARIAERFDVAIMSTKGMSVTASRQLVEHLSAAGVTIFVLHDFDKSGLTILHTLSHSTWRYRFNERPNVIDLGLRLRDVDELGLASEPVQYDSNVDPRHNLRLSGATEPECDFLVHGGGRGGWEGERVELNAMMSDQFMEWLERKLVEHGVAKFVPERPALESAYRRAVRLAALARALDEIEDKDADEEIPVPEDLEQLVRSAIEGTANPWDAAVWDLANDEDETP
jgi:Protein of unknown function C-terminus (DUF2399)